MISKLCYFYRRLWHQALKIQNPNYTDKQWLFHLYITSSIMIIMNLMSLLILIRITTGVYLVEEVNPFSRSFDAPIIMVPVLVLNYLYIIREKRYEDIKKEFENKNHNDLRLFLCCCLGTTIITMCAFYLNHLFVEGRLW